MFRREGVVFILGLLAVAAQAQQPATQVKVLKISPWEPVKKERKTIPPPCPNYFNDSPVTNGVFTIKGKDTTQPVVAHSVNVEFSDEARRAIKKKHLKGFEGASVLSLVVDVNGMPQELCVKKSAAFGLDAQAAAAVRQYQFKPATRNGVPVPARIAIEVNFRLY